MVLVDVSKLHKAINLVVNSLSSSAPTRLLSVRDEVYKCDIRSRLSWQVCFRTHHVSFIMGIVLSFYWRILHRIPFAKEKQTETQQQNATDSKLTVIIFVLRVASALARFNRMAVALSSIETVLWFRMTLGAAKTARTKTLNHNIGVYSARFLL